MRKTGTLLALLLCLLPIFAAAAELDGIDSFVEESMQAWKAPGAAIVVVQVRAPPLDTLVPVKGLRFNIMGLNGFSIEFKEGELIFNRPNGTFRAKRK